MLISNIIDVNGTKYTSKVKCLPKKRRKKPNIILKIMQINTSKSKIW